jgi:hypothetical protein
MPEQHEPSTNWKPIIALFEISLYGKANHDREFQHVIISYRRKCISRIDNITRWQTIRTSSVLHTGDDDEKGGLHMREDVVYIYIDQRSGEQVYTFISLYRYIDRGVWKKNCWVSRLARKIWRTFLHVLLYIYFLRLNSVYIEYILGKLSSLKWSTYMESPSLQIIICRRGTEWMIVVNKAAFSF